MIEKNFSNIKPYFEKTFTNAGKYVDNKIDQFVKRIEESDFIDNKINEIYNKKDEVVKKIGEVVLNHKSGYVENKVEKIENKLEDLREKRDKNLGKLAISKNFKDALILENSKVTSRSEVTDIYVSNNSNRIENSPERTIPQEKVGDKVIEKFSDKRSISFGSPVRDYIIKKGSNRPENSELSSRQLTKDIKNAKRLDKQKLRQLRSKEEERIFGGGIGLGKVSNTRTKHQQRIQKQDTMGRYVEGKITAEQLLNENRRIEQDVKVIVATAGERRAQRRERRGALLGHALVNSSSEFKIPSKIRGNVINKRINRLDKRLESLRETRERIDEEKRKKKKET